MKEHKPLSIGPEPAAFKRQRADAVFGLSVYNALSFSGRDMTADEIIKFLRYTGWHPMWAPFDEVVNEENITRIVAPIDGVSEREGRFVIAVRDPRTRFGRPMSITKDWLHVVPVSHPDAVR